MQETENAQKGILVRQGGMLTVLQDLGRYQYRQYGMPTAGAMDQFSYRVGNLLVENPENYASLEITLIGPDLLFQKESMVAITGAPMKPQLNGREIPMWQSIPVCKGDVISFAELETGCRSYMAVAGGFDLPPVMGSLSTYLRAGIGGYQGRQLKQGDLLPLTRETGGEQGSIRYRYPEHLIPPYPAAQVLRVVLGPQQNFFTAASIRTFLNSEFEIDSTSDRMGCRLNGPTLKHRQKAEILSDGLIPGSVQVPGHGNPIVMLSDCPTSGGYPKIATVISADLPKIGQLKPGDRLAFQRVSLKAAHSAYKVFQDSISKDLLEKIPDEHSLPAESRVYQVIIEGKTFRVQIKKENT